VADASSTTVVIPAFNEADAIGDVIADLRTAAKWHEIIVVDDASSDDTAARAISAGATVVRHPYNKGNGASVKTGIRRAKGEFLLIVDGDGQHPPADAVRLVSRLGEYDLVIGARTGATQATQSRRVGNGMLNVLASYLTDYPIPDLTSGFRAARTEYLRNFIHLLPNGFSTPTTTTLAFLKAGHNVLFEPIEARTRVGHQSKIRLFRDGAKFLLIVLKMITLFSPLRIFLPISVAAFGLGFLYAVWTIATQSHVTNSSVLLILGAVVIFLVGLVSEQIAMLRLENSKHV
jgi:glycosyltransferase involved in cell wall biosynthesis